MFIENVGKDACRTFLEISAIAASCTNKEQTIEGAPEPEHIRAKGDLHLKSTLNGCSASQHLNPDVDGIRTENREEEKEKANTKHMRNYRG